MIYHILVLFYGALMENTIKPRYKLPYLPPFRWLSAIIHSKWMVFFIAIFATVSNVLGLDFYFYCTIAGIAIYISLFGKDYLPYIPLMLFSYVAPSIVNNPSKGDNSIFLLNNGGLTLIIMGGAVAFFLLVRLIFDGQIGFKSMFKTKYKLAGGMLFLGISFAISGLGSQLLSGFEIKNLIFAGVQFAALFIPYFILSFGVRWNKVVKDYIAFTVILFGIVVGLQILFAYYSNGVIVEGRPQNTLIFSGWGVNTNMGAMVALAIPLVFYYISKDKNILINNIIVVFLFFANVLSLSRNSILVGSILYFVCLIVALFKSEKDITKFITFLFIVLLLVALYFFNNYVFNTLGFSFSNGFSPNGRDKLFSHAIETFYSFPLLGGGFYAINSTLLPSELGWNAFFPRMWHNSVLQVMATGGLVCLIAYLIHRVQTIKLLFKNLTIEKVFIGISILALLLMSLLDCYLFQLGPMLFYSSALAFIEHRVPHVKEEPFERLTYKLKKEKLKIKSNVKK